MPTRIIINPANAAKLLPEPGALTEAEAVVLSFTKERKASYNGLNRFDMHKMEAELLKRQPLTQEQWDEAIEALQARKLLMKNKAITNAGRNTIDGTRSAAAVKALPPRD